MAVLLQASKNNERRYVNGIGKVDNIELASAMVGEEMVITSPRNKGILSEIFGGLFIFLRDRASEGRMILQDMVDLME